MERKLKKHGDRSDGLRLAGLVAAGMALRVLFLKSQYAVGWDEAHYLQLAMSFARGKAAMGFHPYWSPAYPVLVSLFSFISPDFEIAGRTASMVCGALTCIPVFFLTKRIAGSAAAFFGSALLCLYPPLAFQSTDAVAESMLILFSVTGVCFGWLALKKQSVYYTILASVSYAVAYLTKPEGAGYFALFMAVSVGYGAFEIFTRKNFKPIRQATVALAVFFALSMPYLIAMQKETGRWTLSSKIFANQQLGAQEYTDPDVNYSRLSEDNTLLPIDAIYHEGNFLRLVSDRKQATRNVNLSVLFTKYSVNLFRTLKYYIPQAFGTVLFILFALGVFCKVWPREKKAVQFYLGVNILAFWLVFIPMFFLVERYFYPGLTLCFIWIGMGMEWFVLWLDEMSGGNGRADRGGDAVRRRKRLNLWIAAAVVFSFSIIPESAKVLSQDKYSTEVYADAVELKEAGRWLKKNAPAPMVLMSTNKGVDFYAGIDNVRATASLTNTDFDRLLSYAGYKHVDYIVFAERYQERFPDLMFLFDDSRIPESIELVYEHAPAPGLRVRIFKIVKVP